VTVHVPGSSDHLRIDETPFQLKRGQRITVPDWAEAVVEFDDGSRVELGPQSEFTIENSKPRQISSFLRVGSLRAWVTKLASRRFRVRSPTAVCSVRGTEFKIQSHFNGRTVIDLQSGLLDVTDKRGKTFTLMPGQRLETDYMGAMGNPRSTKAKTTAPAASGLQAEARRELGLEMGKEEVLAAAAREIKLAEYQQGKALIDVNGYRVRVEQYIMRPRDDQFKLVVLNSRENRFDYFYYLGTFNKTLPTDLNTALSQLSGGLDAAPEYYLTGFETGRSNTVDSVRELAQGGHPVDLNSNADVSDDITSFFDSSADRYIDVTGRSVFKTLYDRYGFYVNGKLKYGWTDPGATLTAYSNRVWSTTNDPITGAALPSALPNRNVSSTFPDSERIHQLIYEHYGDGTSISWDNYIISDEGTVASTDEFSGVTTGTAFREKLLNWNYQQIITATEFNGRKIDLVVAPRILIQAGLIQ